MHFFFARNTTRFLEISYNIYKDLLVLNTSKISRTQSHIKRKSCFKKVQDAQCHRRNLVPAFGLLYKLSVKWLLMYKLSFHCKFIPKTRRRIFISCGENSSAILLYIFTTQDIKIISLVAYINFQSNSYHFTQSLYQRPCVNNLGDNLLISPPKQSTPDINFQYNGLELRFHRKFILKTRHDQTLGQHLKNSRYVKNIMSIQN